MTFFALPHRPERRCFTHTMMNKKKWKQAVGLLLFFMALPVWSWDHYGGVGTYNNGVFFDYQVGNQYGNIELRAGQYIQMNNDWDVNLSVRRYIQHDTNTDGFYFGAFVGQVGAAQVSTQQLRIVGGGFETGYQWVTHFTKMQFFGDMGIDRRLSYGGANINTQPAFEVGASLSLDLRTLFQGKKSPSHK